jgi:hypothetical protein
MSPTARTLAWLRKTGALAQVVERYNPHAKRRVDLFGFIDVVALDGGPGTLGVQTTSAGNVAHRMDKLRTTCAGAMDRWLAAGNRLTIHGWAKRGPRGARKVWTLSARPISRDDLRSPERSGGATWGA